MTPNEKRVLKEFEAVKKANAVMISKHVKLSPHYTEELCQRLHERGYLEVVSPARYPVYRVPSKPNLKRLGVMVILLALLAIGALAVRAQDGSESVARGWSLVGSEKAVPSDQTSVVSGRMPGARDENPEIRNPQSAIRNPRGDQRPVTSDQSVPIDHLIERASQRYQIPAELLYALIKHESRFRPRAISPEGACGLMQLMPDTAHRFGVRNVFDPVENIEAGARYLRFLLDLFNGDLELALAAYNVGEGTIIEYGYRMPPFSDTQQYVRSVLSLYEALRGAVRTGTVEPAQPRGSSPGGMASSSGME